MSLAEIIVVSCLISATEMRCQPVPHTPSCGRKTSVVLTVGGSWQTSEAGDDRLHSAAECRHVEQLNVVSQVCPGAECRQ